MLVMRINSRKKAEKIIHSSKGKHRMHWQKYYSTDRDGGTRTEYLIFYHPVRRQTSGKIIKGEAKQW